jgi:hypothetical protein
MHAHVVSELHPALKGSRCLLCPIRPCAGCPAQGEAGQHRHQLRGVGCPGGDQRRHEPAAAVPLKWTLAVDPPNERPSPSPRFTASARPACLLGRISPVRTGWRRPARCTGDCAAGRCSAPRDPSWTGRAAPAGAGGHRPGSLRPGGPAVTVPPEADDAGHGVGIRDECAVGPYTGEDGKSALVQFTDASSSRSTAASRADAQGGCRPARCRGCAGVPESTLISARHR